MGRAKKERRLQFCFSSHFRLLLLFYEGASADVASMLYPLLSALICFVIKMESLIAHNHGCLLQMNSKKRKDLGATFPKGTDSHMQIIGQI